MPTKYPRRRRAIYAALGAGHHETPAEPLEERAEAVEHWRGQDLTDDEAPPMAPGYADAG